MLYDDILRQVLAPQWDSMKAAFTLHQLKEYEKFIHNKQYGVRKAYYETTLNSQLSTPNSQLPLYDRLVWMLPPQVGRMLVMLYRWVINKKQKNL